MKIKILGVNTRVGDTKDGPRYVHDVVLELDPNDAPFELVAGDACELVKVATEPEAELEPASEPATADPE